MAVTMPDTWDWQEIDWYDDVPYLPESRQERAVRAAWLRERKLLQVNNDDDR